jgi:hypothetical protein
MLFTDGIILSIDDLREHDNFVLEVASTEVIELSSKLSVAQREIGYELTSFLRTRCPGTDLCNVVVTSQLRDLLAMHTLSAVYRDAYNLHLNDRFLGRWREYTKASERGLMRLLHAGVGMAAVPVPQANKPTVSISGQGSLAQGSYAIQVAWQHVTGGIGEKSDRVTVDLSADGSFTVDPGAAPYNTVGWHVFVGFQGEEPVRQNEDALSVSVSWTQAAALRHDLVGTEPSGPDYYVRNSGQIARG